MPTPNKQCPQCTHYRDDIEPYDGRHYYCTAADPPVCIDGYYYYKHTCKEAYINAEKSTYSH